VQFVPFVVTLFVFFCLPRGMEILFGGSSFLNPFKGPACTFIFKTAQRPGRNKARLSRIFTDHLHVTKKPGQAPSPTPAPIMYFQLQAQTGIK